MSVFSNFPSFSFLRSLNLYLPLAPSLFPSFLPPSLPTPPPPYLFFLFITFYFLISPLFFFPSSVSLLLFIRWFSFCSFLPPLFPTTTVAATATTHKRVLGFVPSCPFPPAHIIDQVYSQVRVRDQLLPREQHTRQLFSWQASLCASVQWRCWWQCSGGREEPRRIRHLRWIFLICSSASDLCVIRYSTLWLCPRFVARASCSCNLPWNRNLGLVYLRHLCGF